MLLMPEALSLQYCNLSNPNVLKAAILHNKAEEELKTESELQEEKLYSELEGYSTYRQQL